MDNKVWLLAGLVLVAGVGLSRAVSGAVSKPGLKKGDRILLMGDSLGVGLQTPMKGISDKSGLDTAFQSISVGGTATFQYAPSTKFTNGCGTPNCKERFKAALATFKPTIVLISLGTNDAYGTIDGATIAASSAEIIKMAQDAGAKVVWIGPPTMQAVYSYDTKEGTHVSLKWRPEIIEAIREAAKKSGAAWFDSTGLDLKRFDGLHPNPAAAAGWAANIWQWLSV